MKNLLYPADEELSRRIVLLEQALLEQNTAGEALVESEKRYRRLFESAKDGILILDADTGKVVDVNPFLLQLLGYSYEAIHGQYIWELGVFKDIAASKDAFKTLQENEYIRYEDLPLETLDKRPIAVEFVSNVYLVDHRKVIQCNIRDITARKRAEKALRDSEAKLRGILDNIGIGVSLISPEMEVQEINHRMREWFPAFNPGKHPVCYRLFNDPPRESECENCPTRQTLQDGLVHENTIQIQSAGGIRNFRITSSPIVNASGKITAAIEMVEDITEKLSLESQFLQAQKMEAVGLLAGGVAHDYNNMLSVILGYAELALDQVEQAQPVHAALVEIINAAKRSADITRQLLAFARKQTIAPEVLDMNQIVESMLRMLRRLIGEDINLVWLPESGLFSIKMDPTQVDQILANLCVNARDAIDGVGKITIETKNADIDESYCAGNAGFYPGEYVMLSVSDDGCGMDKEIRDRIFEPFFTSKGMGLGTGLGLSTVYGIVKQNNGFINVYSEPGTGTTFRIYLPRYSDQAVGIREERVEEAPQGCGETVLLVEDEPAILTMTKMMLEKLGYKVLEAGKLGDAIKQAKEHAGEIRLLITDVVMPEMNGRNLAKRLKSICPGIKCLFMSGYTANVIVHRGVLDEGLNFIQKPFSMKNLGIKVRQALD
jgi:PAS domain S-box-containing protein